jgi:hypothetical protein
MFVRSYRRLQESQGRLSEVLGVMAAATPNGRALAKMYLETMAEGAEAQHPRVISRMSPEVRASSSLSSPSS